MIPAECWDEQLAVHPRLLEEAVAPGAGAEPEQVVHPLRRLAQQRHVRVGAARADVVRAAAVEVDALALEPGDVGREVGLDADDRLDPGGLGLLVELVGPEHVAVVGHRHRRLAQLGGPLGQLGQARGAVEHGVLGVHVQVDEGVLAARHGPVSPQGRRVAGTPMSRRRRGTGAPVVLGKDPQPTTARAPHSHHAPTVPRFGRRGAERRAQVSRALRVHSSTPSFDAPSPVRMPTVGSSPDSNRPRSRCSVPT